MGFVCSGDVENPTVSGEEEEEEALETVSFNFCVESLGLVLYSSNSQQVSHLRFDHCSTSWF